MTRSVPTVLLLFASCVNNPTQAPLTTPAPTTAIPRPRDDTAAVLNLVNNARSSAKLPPLNLDANLQAAASEYATEMAQDDQLTHTLHGETLGQRLNKHHYKFSYAGENIGAGQRTPQEIFNAWMSSPGHRANLLNPKYKDTGIGEAVSANGVTYWSMEFGSQ